MDDSLYNWILSGPVCISLVGNLIFLIVIISILTKKVQAAQYVPESQTSSATKQAIRATLILIPLLGTPYLLQPIRPPNDSSWVPYYHFITAIFSSFQVSSYFTASPTSKHIEFIFNSLKLQKTLIK